MILHVAGKRAEGWCGHRYTEHPGLDWTLHTAHNTRNANATLHTTDTAPDGSWKVDPRRLVVAAPGVRVLSLHSSRGGVIGDQGIHPAQDHVSADLVVEPEVVHPDGEGRSPERVTYKAHNNET